MSLSVIIPVLNEEETIDACIAGVRAIEGGEGCEVIVVDGHPRATTLAAVTDPDAVRVRSEPGRAVQMNMGAARARGEVLVFLHADTGLPPTAAGDIAAVLADPGVVAGAFAHRFDSPRLVYRIISAVVSRLTRWNRLPYGDQAIFVRRDYFERIDGFAPIEIMEDQELVRRIRRRGDHLALLEAPARTSVRRLEYEGIVRRVVTNWAMTVMYALGVPPRRLVRYYRPHGDGFVRKR
jgi:rSAM/selenodomain-associated transferase 2